MPVTFFMGNEFISILHLLVFRVLWPPFEHPSPYMSNIHKLSRSVFLSVFAKLSVYAFIIFKRARNLVRAGDQSVRTSGCDMLNLVAGSLVARSRRGVNSVTDRDDPISSRRPVTTVVDPSFLTSQVVGQVISSTITMRTGFSMLPS